MEDEEKGLSDFEVGVGAEEAGGLTNVSKTTSPAYAMNILIDTRGHVEVDDVLDSRDVEAS